MLHAADARNIRTFTGRPSSMLDAALHARAAEIKQRAEITVLVCSRACCLSQPLNQHT
jgi:hypothetical protein